MSTTDATRAEEPLTEPVDLEPDEPVTEPDTHEPDTPVRRLPRTPRELATMLAPALVFLGIREIGLLVLTWMAAVNGNVVSESLSSWDGQWFLGIALGGYDDAPGDLRDALGHRFGTTPLAFFPGYPTLMRVFAGIDGPGGIGLVTAGITITIAAGVCCAFGLARLGNLVGGGSRRVGLVLVALFAASPMAVVLSMVYSEALFCALAAWALVGVLERRWVLAGVCCALAGLVRPTAAALVLVVGLAAMLAVVERWDDWRPWFGGLLAPLGLVGFLGWVGWQTGRIDGWFRIQRDGWQTGFDGGTATWGFVVRTLGSPDLPFMVVTVGLIIVSLVVAVLCVVRRLPWPLLVYGLGALVMDLASDGLMNSKVRLMIPAFTLLIPIAIGLAKRRTSTVVITLAALVAASSWFGAYAITAWPYAI